MRAIYPIEFNILFPLAFYDQPTFNFRTPNPRSTELIFNLRVKWIIIFPIQLVEDHVYTFLNFEHTRISLKYSLFDRWFENLRLERQYPIFSRKIASKQFHSLVFFSKNYPQEFFLVLNRPKIPSFLAFSQKLALKKFYAIFREDFFIEKSKFLNYLEENFLLVFPRKIVSKQFLFLVFSRNMARKKFFPRFKSSRNFFFSRFFPKIRSKEILLPFFRTIFSSRNWKHQVALKKISFSFCLENCFE